MTSFQRIIFLTLFLLNTGVKPEVQISGFGTFGFVYNDSDIFGFRKDITYDDASYKNDFDFNSTTVLGLQLDYQASEEFDVVLQLIHRNQNDVTLDSYSELAFLRYSPSPDWSLRLGRSALDLFMLTEYREIGFAIPWAKVPTELYGLVPYRHLDGMDISYQFQKEGIFFRTKFFTGASDIKLSIAGYDDRISLKDIIGLTFDVEHSQWTFDARHTHVTFDNNSTASRQLIDVLLQIPEQLWPDASRFASLIDLEGSKASYSSLGFKHLGHPLSIMGEYAIIRSSENFVSDVNTGYLSAIYTTDINSFFINFSKSQVKGSKAGNLQTSNIFPDLAKAVDDNINFYNSNQSTWSLGWRYYLTENLAFKVQWDNTKVDENASRLWKIREGINPTPEDRINTVFVNLSFVF